MKRNVISLLLSALLLLSLTACGKREEAPPGALHKAMGLDTDAVLLTVDGREVAAGQYFYWLAEICDSITSQYEKLEKKLNWAEPLGNMTLAEYAKEQALRSAALYATVENWAERYGCALTAADREALAADWQARAEAAGGEEAYLDRLGQKGLDRAGAERMAEDHYLYAHLFDLAMSPDSALWPDTEELAAFFQEQGYLTVDLLTVSKAGADSQEALEACRQKISTLFSQLNQSGGSPEAFASLAEAENGEERGYPKTLPPGDGTLPEAFAAAASALDEGQLSGILEAEEAYGILLRLPADLEAVREDWFDWKLQAAADSAAVEVTGVYQALDVPEFQAALEQARQS